MICIYLLNLKLFVACIKHEETTREWGNRIEITLLTVKSNGDLEPIIGERPRQDVE